MRCRSGSARTLPFDSQTALRAALGAAHPHLVRYDVVTPADPAELTRLSATGETRKDAFATPVRDFYLTNPIARASRVMAECSALASARLATAAE